MAKGYKGLAELAFESAFKTAPEGGGFLIPFNSNGVTSSRSQSQPGTITGRRDPVEPDEGKLDAGGTLVVPVDAHSFGLHLKALLGAPSTAVVPALTLDADNAVNLGSGKVGLPCTGHGLAKGAPVMVSGTTAYDGAYVLAPETTDDLVVIVAAYASESFAGDEVVRLGHLLTLDTGDAVNIGGGKVGLPCAGHGLPCGAEVTLSGTVAYDGTHTLVRGTSTSQLVITASYTAETFVGNETVQCLFHEHTYDTGDELPSYLLEKRFPDVPVFFPARGCKTGSLQMSVGTDGELTASVEVLASAEDKNTAAHDATAVRLPFARFKMYHAVVAEGGATLRDRFTSLSLNISNGLDEDGYTIGAGGERGAVDEGLMSVTGSLEALFKDTTYTDKALNSTVSSLELRFVNGGYGLCLRFPEVKYARKTPPIDGPKGVRESLEWSGYYEDAPEDACVRVTLRNEIKTWEV